MNWMTSIAARIRRHAAPVAALLAVCLATPAAAVLIEVQPKQPTLRQLFRDQQMLRGFQQGGLSGVVDLLRAGRRDEANQRLAAILRTNPDDPAALDLMGSIMLDQGDTIGAEQQFRRAIAVQPDRASAIAKLGVVLLFKGEAAQAEAALQAALQKAPDEPVALAYMGWIERDRGNTAEAIAYLEKLQGAQSSDQRGLGRSDILLAELYNAVRNFPAAQRLLEHGIAETRDPELRESALFNLYLAAYGARNIPASKAALDQFAVGRPAGDFALETGRALIAEIEGDIPAARIALERVLARSPDRATQVYHALASMSVRAGEVDRAQGELEKAAAAATPRELPLILRELAASLVSSGKTPKAIATLTEAADKHPDQPMLRYVLAETLSLSGNRAGALAATERLIKQHPKFVTAYFLNGTLRWHNNDRNGAVAAWQKAVDLNPSFVPAWRALAGGVHLTKGDAAMNEVFSKAAAANPNDPVLASEIASNSYAAGKLADAAAQYRKIIERNPNFTLGLMNLALALADLGQIQEARTMIDRAVALDPDEPLVKDTMGWVLFRAGEHAKAIQVLNEAMKALPKDGGVRYHLGIALLNAGQNNQATEMLKAAQRLGLPGHYRAETRKILANAR